MTRLYARRSALWFIVGTVTTVALLIIADDVLGQRWPKETMRYLTPIGLFLFVVIPALPLRIRVGGDGILIGVVRPKFVSYGDFASVRASPAHRLVVLLTESGSKLELMFPPHVDVQLIAGMLEHRWREWVTRPLATESVAEVGAYRSQATSADDLEQAEQALRNPRLPTADRLHAFRVLGARGNPVERVLAEVLDDTVNRQTRKELRSLSAPSARRRLHAEQK